MTSLDVRQIEGATLSAWPALRIVHDGSWLWRYANGYTRRANSIQCMDPGDGNDAEERLAHLGALSERWGIAPTFRVTPLTAPMIVAVLDAQLWSEFGQSLVLAMRMPEQDFPVGGMVKHLDPGDPEWYRAQAQMAGTDEDSVKAFREIIELISCPARGVLAYHKAGVPVAAALYVVVGGIAIYLNVVTYQGARGMGFGRLVMHAALNGARAMGAEYSAIQVAADNAAARALYASVGFLEAYAYAYRRPATWAAT